MLEAKLLINQVAVISINKAMNSPISQDQYLNMLKVVTLLCSEQENIYIFRNLIHSEMALMENSNPSVAQLRQYLTNSTFLSGMELPQQYHLKLYFFAVNKLFLKSEIYQRNFVIRSSSDSFVSRFHLKSLQVCRICHCRYLGIVVEYLHYTLWQMCIICDGRCEGYVVEQ